MIIETTALRKSFTRRFGRSAVAVEAVNGIDLAVKESEIFGFLGPNGAGKTTTMRMLTTLLRPDAGEATVAGHDLLTQPQRIRSDIGYVQQAGGLWELSTPREELTLQGRFQGLGARSARAKASEVLERLDIAEFADRRCCTLSGGQRRRVEIGLGIVHSPVLLFLDEPSAGLDPQSRAAFWDTIRGLRESGMTVFLTTHYLDEADALCDRVSIVDHGRVVTTGSPAELKRELAGEIITMTLASVPDVVRTMHEELAEDERIVRSELTGNDLRLVVQRGDSVLPGLVQRFAAAGVGVTAVDLHHASLDDVFLDKTGRSLRTG